MKYRSIEKLVGGFVFVICSIVYILTAEPSMSLWDCGEFISCTAKQQVPHPPGAPFFLILARALTFYLPADKIAYGINILSGIFTAFACLFLYFVTTILIRRSLFNGLDWAKKVPNFQEGVVIIGGGLVAALSCCFADSVWFSAVEAEVYAASLFFASFVAFLAVKWMELRAINPDKNYYNIILLISYLIGLSVGVHLLSLLVIPFVTTIIWFSYYEKKFSLKKNIFFSLILGSILLFAVQYGVVQWSVDIMDNIELFFVNDLGLPFYSGVIATFILILIILWWCYSLMVKKGRYMLGTIFLSFIFVYLGYSTFGMILIRAYANTPINQNNPEHPFTFISYLRREQYGDRPLLYGQFYSTPIDPAKFKDGSPLYYPDWVKKRYVLVDARKNAIPGYCDAASGFFPRMWSPSDEHKEQYENWVNIKGRKAYCPGYGQVTVPTFWENIQFFLKYQVGWMYLRYFFWNFVGRQNDLQGHGSPDKGNFITGISFIDDLFTIPREDMPPHLANNKGYNKYYAIPLLLGLIGAYFHFLRRKDEAYATLLLWFFTGIAIIIYLNQYPLQPRERDYSYAGSIWAYCIWIGMAVPALSIWLYSKIQRYLSSILALLISLIGPTLMALENWDDHSRANRTAAREMAKYYLDSCDENAILFTNGDNDTFPLWYLQETEEYRTDIRVCNLSLLNTDWYIDQMKRQVYSSKPLPIPIPSHKYWGSKRDFVRILHEDTSCSMLINDFLNFIFDDKNTLGGREIFYAPCANIKIPVDKEKVIKNGIVPPQDSSKIVDTMYITLPRNIIYKSQLFQLVIIANSNWERPIYFAATSGFDTYVGFQDYLQLEGMAYKLVPIKSSSGGSPLSIGSVNTNKMYDNLVNKFNWTPFTRKDVYYSEDYTRMVSYFKIMFARTAEDLFEKQKYDSVKKVLNKLIETFPNDLYPYDIFMVPPLKFLRELNEIQKLLAVSDTLIQNASLSIKYYMPLILAKKYYSEEAISQHFYIIKSVEEELRQAASIIQDTQLLDKINQLLQKIKEITDYVQNSLREIAASESAIRNQKR